jgi:methylenetetrahydrofolate dehydrogenase (NADP+)/methenyltetrahydrofolate cyclohydrolase
VAAQILDGKSLAASIRAALKERVAALVQRGVKPGLAVVLAGDDPASRVYVRNKRLAATETGVHSELIELPGTIGQRELRERIEALNANRAIHGILVQLPLPKQIDATVVIDAIEPTKDVDGFHPVNIGLLASRGAGFVPCTPLGCLLLLKSRFKSLSGMRAVIVGRSNIVGKPLAQLLLREDCTVTVAHSRTRDLADECRRADVLVAAVGRPQMIPGDWIKPGATVIDVGINRIADPDDATRTRLVGDVDFTSAVDVAGAITPVPGGVGPMTIACLLRNTLTAATASVVAEG